MHINCSPVANLLATFGILTDRKRKIVHVCSWKERFVLNENDAEIKNALEHNFSLQIYGKPILAKQFTSKLLQQHIMKHNNSNIRQCTLHSDPTRISYGKTRMVAGLVNITPATSSSAFINDTNWRRLTHQCKWMSFFTNHDHLLGWVIQYKKHQKQILQSNIFQHYAR